MQKIDSVPSTLAFFGSNLGGFWLKKMADLGYFGRVLVDFEVFSRPNIVHTLYY